MGSVGGKGHVLMNGIGYGVCRSGCAGAREKVVLSTINNKGWAGYVFNRIVGVSRRSFAQLHGFNAVELIFSSCIDETQKVLCHLPLLNRSIIAVRLQSITTG